MGRPTKRKYINLSNLGQWYKKRRTGDQEPKSPQSGAEKENVQPKDGRAFKGQTLKIDAEILTYFTAYNAY